MKPRVRLLAFGGTIAMVSRVPGGGVEPTLASADLVGGLTALGELAELETVDFAPIASYELTPADMLPLAREVGRAAAEGCAGVVITHGTDSVEECAYLLALTTPRRLPVVLTGALRNPTLESPDGPANLVAAVRVATTPGATVLGPVLVHEDGAVDL